MDFPAKWYADANKKNRENKKKKPHWEVKHRLPTQMRSSYQEQELLHCPKLCMQQDSGNYGKRTFNGRKCIACGYEKIIEGTEYRSEEVFAYETIVEYATQILKTKPVIKMRYFLLTTTYQTNINCHIRKYGFQFRIEIPSCIKCIAIRNTITL